MTAVEQLRRLRDHAAWADLALLAELEHLPAVAAEVLREYAHILAAESVWLARLEGRLPTSAIWPDLALPAVAVLARENVAGYARLLAGLGDAELSREVPYVNSAGLAFTNTVSDILLHVLLHGQYHRGKVNLLLRESALEPVPFDFITFVRGRPAATTPRA
ncbi:MAG: DinB family protein [bacterium]